MVNLHFRQKNRGNLATSNLVLLKIKKNHTHTHTHSLLKIRLYFLSNLIFIYAFHKSNCNDFGTSLINLLTNNPRFSRPKEESFEKIVGKAENDCHQHFLLSHNVFYPSQIKLLDFVVCKSFQFRQV